MELGFVEETYYKYFLLKNGPRLTAFKVKDSLLSKDLDIEIQQMLKIYPEGTEIYPISKEEYDLLHKYKAELRRLFQKAQKRCVFYKNPKQDVQAYVDFCVENLCPSVE